MRGLAAIVRGAVVLCFLAAPALADSVKFSADLQPTKPGDPGKGTMTLTLDTVSKKLDWTVEYSGIKSPPEMAGFMTPPAKPEADPDMIPVTLPSPAASPIKGSMALTDPQVASIETQKWIFLIGTKEAPEIGGEVKKAP
ncbi:MAG TPA: CHRD domain-containing protein [Stellaceae bacterium]|nr:CHRD domain-containing protein [Stellaceae bacterium]